MSGRKRKRVHEETGVTRLCDCGDCPGVKQLTPRAIRQHHQNKRQKMAHGEEFKIAVRADSDDDDATGADFDLSCCDVDRMRTVVMENFPLTLPRARSRFRLLLLVRTIRTTLILLVMMSLQKPRLGADRGSCSTWRNCSLLAPRPRCFTSLNHNLSETCMIDLFDVVSAILPKDNAMIQYAVAKREVSGCVHGA